MSFCMTKLEFPPESYMFIQARKNSTYMLLAFALSVVKLCEPYERFVMLLKSRSRTHHPHMHYSYTGRRRKTWLPSRSTQKCSTPTLGVNTKNYFIGFPPNKCSKVFVAITQKFCCREEAWVMQKLFIKKRKRKVLGKMDKCLRH